MYNPFIILLPSKVTLMIAGCLPKPLLCKKEVTPPSAPYCNLNLSHYKRFMSHIGHLDGIYLIENYFYSTVTSRQTTKCPVVLLEKDLLVHVAVLVVLG